MSNYHNVERAPRGRAYQYYGYDASGRRFFIMRPNKSNLVWCARTANGFYHTIRADTLGKLADKLASLCVVD